MNIKISVRYRTYTYIAVVDGANCQASCTAGADLAARRAASKYFGVDDDEVVVKQTGGTVDRTFYSAAPKAEGFSRRSGMSVDELFQEVMRGQPSR